MRKQYFEVVNTEKFNAEILEVCQEYGIECADEIGKYIGINNVYLRNKLLKTLTNFPCLRTEGMPVGEDSLYVKVYLDLGDYGEPKALSAFTLNSGEFKSIKL